MEPQLSWFSGATVCFQRSLRTYCKSTYMLFTLLKFIIEAWNWSESDWKWNYHYSRLLFACQIWVKVSLVHLLVMGTANSMAGCIGDDYSIVTRVITLHWCYPRALSWQNFSFIALSTALILLNSQCLLWSYLYLHKHIPEFFMKSGPKP